MSLHTEGQCLTLKPKLPPQLSLSLSLSLSRSASSEKISSSISSKSTTKLCVISCPLSKGRTSNSHVSDPILTRVKILEISRSPYYRKLPRCNRPKTINYVDDNSDAKCYDEPAGRTAMDPRSGHFLDNFLDNFLENFLKKPGDTKSGFENPNPSSTSAGRAPL